MPIVGTALVNLAEYVSAAEHEEVEVNVPLTSDGGAAEPRPTLCVCAIILEVVNFRLFA